MFIREADHFHLQPSSYGDAVGVDRIYPLHMTGGKWWTRIMADMPMSSAFYGPNGYRRRTDLGQNYALVDRQAYAFGTSVNAVDMTAQPNDTSVTINATGVSGNDITVLSRVDDPVVAGRQVWRVFMDYNEIRPDGSGALPATTASGIHRIEVKTSTATANMLAKGTELWEFYAYYLPSSVNWAGMTTQDWWHVQQLHLEGSGSGVGPPFSIILASGGSTSGGGAGPSTYHFRLAVEWEGTRVDEKFIASPALNKWHYFAVHNKISDGGDGFVKVYHAVGDSVTDPLYTGPTLIQNYSGQWGSAAATKHGYFKAGMYQSGAYKGTIPQREYYMLGIGVIKAVDVPWMTPEKAIAAMRRQQPFFVAVAPSDPWTDPQEPPPRNATTHKHVNINTGVDQVANGSEAAPYATLNYALGQITGGQQNFIWMNRGTANQLGGSALTISKNGAGPTARLYVGAYGLGARPIIRSTVASGGTLMQVTGGAKYMQFEDLDLDGEDSAAAGWTGPSRLFDILNSTTSRVEYIDFRRCLFRRSRDHGLVTTNQLQSNGLAVRNLRAWYCDATDVGHHGFFNTNSDDFILTRCRAFRTGNRVGAHGFSAYGVHVSISNTGQWTQFSGNVYRKAETMEPVQVQTDIPNRKRLYKTTNAQNAPGNNEFGYTGGYVYVNVGGAPSALIRWSVLDLNYTAIDCYTEDTKVFMPYPSSGPVIFEGAGFQADDMSRFQLTRCEAKNPYGAGFFINSSDGSTMTDCSVSNSGTYAVRNNNSKNVTVTRLTATTCGDPSKKATDGRDIVESNFPYADITAFGANNMSVVDSDIVTRSTRYGFTRQGGGNCTRSNTTWSGGVNIGFSSGAWVPFTGS